MNITIENKEMTVSTVKELMEAQSKLLEAFAQSIMGTREAIKEEVREEVRDEVIKDILSKSGDLNIGVDDFTAWLDEMNSCGFMGLSDDDIREKVMHDALSSTDYSDIEEMTDALDEMQRAFSEVYDAISEYI